VAATSVADAARHQRIDAVGTGPRCSTAIHEAVAAFLLEAHDPFVAGLAADAFEADQWHTDGGFGRGEAMTAATLSSAMSL